jgi:hypothetical protein
VITERNFWSLDHLFWSFSIAFGEKKIYGSFTDCICGTNRMHFGFHSSKEILFFAFIWVRSLLLHCCMDSWHIWSRLVSFHYIGYLFLVPKVIAYLQDNEDIN